MSYGFYRVAFRKEIDWTLDGLQATLAREYASQPSIEVSLSDNVIGKYRYRSRSTTYHLAKRKCSRLNLVKIAYLLKRSFRKYTGQMRHIPPSTPLR